MKQRLLLLSLILAISTTPAFGQMSKFKALFLYNFAKNIEWPDQAVGNSFVVTIVGDNELASELNELAKVRKVGNRSLLVKETSTVDQLGNSQIIYLGASKSSLMQMLNSYQKENPTLLVGSKDGLCAEGAGISFVTIDGKLKFQICPSNIERQGLNLAQKLVYLGIEVQ